MSLENPQLEDGFTPVANTIMEPICHTRLSGTDWALLHFLWRKTYGWSKPSDIISLSQFCEGTGMEQAHVCRTIKRLLAMNVIFRHVARIGKGDTATYEFNKRVWAWKSLPMLAIPHKSLPELAIQSLPELAHTTERSTTTEKREVPKDIVPTEKVLDKKESVELAFAYEVLAYLNLKANHSYEMKPNSVFHILALLRQGATVQQLKLIIDYKVDEWNKPDFRKNLNNATLFRVKMFSTYLEDAKKWQERQHQIADPFNIGIGVPKSPEELEKMREELKNRFGRGE